MLCNGDMRELFMIMVAYCGRIVSCINVYLMILFDSSDVVSDNNIVFVEFDSDSHILCYNIVSIVLCKLDVIVSGTNHIIIII